jgi:uncharacterized repeat protein (TIGR04076 family)
MTRPVKITVVAKLTTEDVYGSMENAPAELMHDYTPECPIMEVGDEFIVEDIVSCPAGFCAWAFADIQRDIVTLMFGGKYPWLEEEGKAVSCCTDGLRPVMFLLELM